MKHTAFILSLICATAWADNSQPWQDARINEINREPMTAHFLPFISELCPMKSVSK